MWRFKWAAISFHDSNRRPARSGTILGIADIVQSCAWVDSVITQRVVRSCSAVASGGRTTLLHFACCPTQLRNYLREWTDASKVRTERDKQSGFSQGADSRYLHSLPEQRFLLKKGMT